MTLFAELSGARITSGRIVIPYVGAWHADLTLDKEVTPAAPLVLVLGNLTMRGTAWRPIVPFQGRTEVRMIGGSGGWRKTIRAQGYSLPGAVRLSLVLNACAKECGETIEIPAAADRVLGSHYSREVSPGTRHLNTLAPGSWRIDPDGVTRIGARESKRITSPFTVTAFNGARGLLVIATESPADIVPGRTIQGLTMKAPVTIGGVTHLINSSGIRTEILAA